MSDADIARQRRDYIQMNQSAAEYIPKLARSVERGHCAAEELLACAKTAYVTSGIPFNQFAPIAVAHERGLAESLHGFPRRDHPYNPTLERLTAWYLIKTITGETDVCIQDTRDDVAVALVVLNREPRVLEATVHTSFIETNIAGSNDLYALNTRIAHSIGGMSPPELLDDPELTYAMPATHALKQLLGNAPRP